MYYNKKVNSKNIKYIKQNWKNIEYIENPSEEVQLIAVRQNWQAIKFIEKPSEEVQLIAVRQNWQAIEFIKNLSEKIQLEIVRTSGINIKYVNNPSNKLQMLAIKNSGKFALKYVKTEFLISCLQTEFNNVDSNQLDNSISKELFEEIKLEAIKRKYEAIKFIKNPTEEFLFKALKVNWRIIQFIKNPSDHIQLAALKQSRNAIRFINNPSEQIQLEAIKTTGRAIQFIKNPTQKVKLEAVSKTGNAIRFIKNPSEKMQLEAIKREWVAIKFIENPLQRVRLEAIHQNWEAIKFIKNPSEEDYIAVVRKMPSALRFIKSPSLDVQLAAVKQNGFVIEYIENPFEIVKLEAVQQIRESRNNDKAGELSDRAFENVNLNETTEIINITKLKSNNTNQEIKDTTYKIDDSIMKYDDIPSNKLKDYNNYKVLKKNGGNGNPQKVERSVMLSKRNITIVNNLKKIYNNKCQICDTRLEIECNRYISEAHHIQPLGNHNGADIIENMIVLCPNCHAMFDRGAITIDISNNVVKHVNPNNPLNNTKITIKHSIGKKYVDYHTHNIYKSNLISNKDNNQNNKKYEKHKRVLENNNKIDKVTYGSLAVVLDISTNDTFKVRIEESWNKQFMTNIQKELLSKKLNEIFCFENYTYKVIKILN